MQKEDLKIVGKEQKAMTVLQIDYHPKQRNYFVTGRVVTEHDLKVITSILVADFIRCARENFAMDGCRAMQFLVNCVEDGLRFYGEKTLEDAGLRYFLRPEKPCIDIVKGRDYFERIDDLIDQKN